MHGKSRLIYFIEYSWLFVLLLFASMVYLNQENIGLFFNSDMLSPVLLFKDVFFQHGHYKDWYLPSVPHFFPDMFILAPVFFIIKNTYFYFLITIWMMIISIYIAVKLIYVHFFPVKKSIILALIATSSLFLLALNNVPAYNLALFPFYHVGEFIAGLFLISIQLNLINKADKLTCRNYVFCCLSALIAFASSLSDLLFFLQFAIPIFIGYSFLFLKRCIKFYPYLLFSTLIIFPAILGVSLTKYLMPKDALLVYLSHPSLTKVSFSTINIQLIALIQLVKSSSNYLIWIVCGIFYLGLIFTLINQLFFKDKKNYNDKKLFLSLFVFLSVFLSVVSQFYLVHTVYVSIRYMIPLFFFPFLLFFFPVAYFINKLLTSRILNYLAGLLCIYILVSLLVLISKPGFKLHRSYYPQYVHCIDKALRGYGHNGMAQYWEANLITALSKEDIEVVPVVNLNPFVWLVNKTKFKKPFNFVILELFINNLPFPPLEEALVYRRYGMPDKLVVCGKRKILIYSKNLTLN